MVNVVHRLALGRSVGVMVVVANVVRARQVEGLVSLACVRVHWRSSVLRSLVVMPCVEIIVGTQVTNVPM